MVRFRLHFTLCENKYTFESIQFVRARDPLKSRFYSHFILGILNRQFVEEYWQGYIWQQLKKFFILFSSNISTICRSRAWWANGFFALTSFLVLSRSISQRESIVLQSNRTNVFVSSGVHSVDHPWYGSRLLMWSVKFIWAENCYTIQLLVKLHSTKWNIHTSQRRVSLKSGAEPLRSVTLRTSKKKTPVE